MDESMNSSGNDAKGGHKKPYVDLWKRMIKELPVDSLMKNYPKMTVLNLGENCISTLTGIEALVNLQELYLFCNIIEIIPPEISQLKELKKLVLRQNEIAFLPPELGKLQNLKVLNVENNRLNSIPGQLRHCPKLKELNVQRNRIKKIPTDLILGKIEKLLTEGNRKIVFPPLSVSEKGSSAVLKYLKDEHVNRKDKSKEKLSRPSITLDQELTIQNSSIAAQYPNLKTLLSDSKGLELFTAFLESEFATENLFFWQEAEEYSQLDPANHGLLKDKANRIYNIYIKDGADQEINIPSHIRNEIIDVFKKGDHIGIHLFDHAQKNVFYTMEQDPFKRFLRSR